MANKFNEDHPHLELYIAAAAGRYSSTSASIEEGILRFIGQGNTPVDISQIRYEVKAQTPMHLWTVDGGLRELTENGYIQLENDFYDLTPEMRKRTVAKKRFHQNNELARRIVFGFEEEKESREVRALRYILKKEPGVALEMVLLNRLDFGVSGFVAFRSFMQDLIERGLVLHVKRGAEEAYRLSTEFHLRIRQLQHEKAEQATNELTPDRPGSLYASNIPPIIPHLFEATIKIKGVEIDIGQLKNLYALMKKRVEDPTKDVKGLASALGYKLEFNEIMALYTHLKKLGLFETA